MENHTIKRTKFTRREKSYLGGKNNIEELTRNWIERLENYDRKFYLFQVRTSKFQTNLFRFCFDIGVDHIVRKKAFPWELEGEVSQKVYPIVQGRKIEIFPLTDFPIQLVLLYCPRSRLEKKVSKFLNDSQKLKEKVGFFRKGRTPPSLFRDCFYMNSYFQNLLENSIRNLFKKEFGKNLTFVRDYIKLRKNNNSHFTYLTEYS